MAAEQFKIKIEELRSTEFAHLNQKIYLDHAANTIYMKSLIHDYYLKLTDSTSLFSNPHSHSESGIYTHNYVNLTRQNVLNLFKTSSNEYELIFVSNATNGLKLLAETFQFSSGSVGDQKASFAYLNDNHTSVIGMRELAWSRGYCDVFCVYEDLNVELVVQDKNQSTQRFECTRDLFVYPAQSNFNARKYPLDWISRVQSDGIAKKNNWFVCLDAASYVCTSVLDLSKVKPDFLVISFYYCEFFKFSFIIFSGIELK